MKYCGMLTLRSLAIYALCLLAETSVNAQEARTLLQKAYQFRMENADSCIAYATRAYDLAVDARDDTLAAEALFVHGMSLQTSGRFLPAVEVFRKIFSLDLPPENVFIVRANRRIGLCYVDLAVYDSALIYLTQFDHLVDKYWGVHYPDAKLDLGELYRAMGNLEQSNVYKLEAIDRARAGADRTDRIMTLYYFLDDNIQRIDDPYFKPFLDEYLLLIDAENARDAYDPVHTPLLLNTIPPEQRIMLLTNAIRQYPKSGETRSTIFFYQLLTTTYRTLGKLPEAVATAKSGLDLARKSGNAGYILQYNHILSGLHRQLQQFDTAMDYQDTYYRLRDSLVSADSRENMDSLRIFYETAEKEARIAEQELAIERSRHQRNLLLLGLAVVVLSGAFLIWYFWHRNRLARKLAAQESLLNRQRIAQLEQEKRLYAMDAMMEGQEAERMRIAQDLHDGLGGLLSNVKAHFSVIAQRIELPEELNLYQKVNTLIDSASKEVRRISHNMAPHALRFGGLADALDDLVAQLRRHQIEIQFDWTGSRDPLPEHMEIMLYRITQELTNNVIRHASADHLLIQVNRFAHDLTMTIEDDGSGFRPEHPSRGIGLQSVQSRVDYLHGNIDIDSEEGVGTTVTIEVPLLGG